MNNYKGRRSTTLVIVRGYSSELLQYLRSGIGGAIIYDDYFQMRISLRIQSNQAALDITGFIPGGDDDRDQRCRGADRR